MKQQKIIWLGAFAAVALIAAGMIYWTQSSKTSSNNKEAAVGSEQQAGFKGLTSQELSDMLRKKDFSLIDVHIPEQVHIPGTDYMIPYNDIDTLVSALPDKNAKVVLYCRSGSMSKIAAEALAEKGYVNVFNLTNGMNEWLVEGRETAPKGSVPTGILSENIAYVALGPSNQVAVINMDDGTVIDVLPAGNNPHGIAAAGGYIFTSSTRMGPKEMLMEPDHNDGEPMDMKRMMSLGSNTIAVIDPEKKKIIKEINVDGGSHHMAATPDGVKVLASVPSLSGVAIIDAESLEETNFVKTGKITNYVAVSPDGTKAYVTNKGEDTLSVIDLKTESVTANIPTGLRPDHIAVGKEGKFVYVSNAGDDTVSVIDVQAQELVDAIEVGETPHGLSVLPDGQRLYVANSESRDVSVIDLSKNMVINTIQMGQEVSHLEAAPNGKRVLVNSESAKKIYIIDAAQDKIVDTIMLDQEPHQVTFQ